MALSFPGSLVDSFIEDDLMKEDGLGEFLVPSPGFGFAAFEMIMIIMFCFCSDT